MDKGEDVMSIFQILICLLCLTVIVGLTRFIYYELGSSRLLRVASSLALASIIVRLSIEWL
jgi:hypothetical protein